MSLWHMMKGVRDKRLDEIRLAVFFHSDVEMSDVERITV